MIEIVTSLESLKKYDSGSITGEIFLRSESACFPEESWSDFPVVILSWWIDGLNQLASGKARSFAGNFMDGPFAFRVDAGQGDLGRISWGRRGFEQPIASISIATLHRSTIAAGHIVSAACQAKQWESKDLGILREALSRSAA